MKKSAFYSILLASATLAATASADELNQTISVTKENEVVEHKATKMASLPDAAPVKAQTSTLSFSDWAVPAQVDPLLVVQNPQRQADSFSFRNKRGYAEFGMGNYLNMVGSFGYRILDSQRSSLAVWLQHNSANGSVSNPLVYNDYYTVGNGEARKHFYLENRIGADFKQRLSAGDLSANLVYHLSKFNYYGMMYPRVEQDVVEKKQKANEFGIALKWDSPANEGRSFGYHAGVNYNFLGYGDPLREFTDQASALKEHHFGVNAGGEFVWDEDSHIGINVAYEYLTDKNRIQEYGQFNSGTITFGALFNDRSQGMFTAAPYYKKANEKMNLRLGVRLDIASTGTTFRIAPDVKFDLKFNDRAALALSATGGNRMNPLHVVAERNRYVNPSMALTDNTFTLVDAEARLNLGLFKGFTLSPFVGYAVVRNAYLPEYQWNALLGASLPMTPDLLEGTVCYGSHNQNGFKAGLDFTLKLRRFAEIKAGYMFTPQGDESGYIANDDRAEHAVNALLTVHPIKALDIWASYHFRSGRNVTMVSYLDGENLRSNAEQSLGVVSDFGVGASYRINDLLHVYAQGNNLFNRRWQNYFGMRNQGINFLVGVGVEF